MFRKLTGLIVAAAMIVMQGIPCSTALAASDLTDGGASKTIDANAAKTLKKTTISASTQEANKWNTASDKIADTAKASPDKVDVAAFTTELNNYATAAKASYDKTGTKFDTSTADKNYLTAANAFVKSDAFAKLSEAQQNKFVNAVAKLSIEIWRGSDSKSEKTAMYAQIGEFYKNAYNKSATVSAKAHTVDSLLYVFMIVKQNDATGATKLLKAGLKVSGGMEAVTSLLKSNINNAKLTDDQRSRMAIVATKLLSLEKYVKQASGYDMSDTMKSGLKAQINSFTEKVNSGDVKLSAWYRARLVYWTGNLSTKLVKAKEANSGANKTFVDNAVTLAHKTMLLAESKGGSVYAQSVAISSLTVMNNAAAKAKNTDVTKDTKAALTDKDFNVKDYLANAKTSMAKETSADRAAVIAKASVRIVTKNVEYKTGAVDAAMVENVLDNVKNWTSTKANLLDMRHLTSQKNLFVSVADLAVQLKKDSSEVKFSDAMKKDVESIKEAAEGLADDDIKKAAVKELDDALKAKDENAKPKPMK